MYALVIECPIFSFFPSPQNPICYPFEHACFELNGLITKYVTLTLLLISVAENTSIIYTAEKPSLKSKMDCVFWRSPHLLPSPPYKWVSYILSTGMAWSVTCVLFDFCKRKINESGIRTFWVNILPVSQSLVPAMKSWNLLGVLHEAATLSVQRLRL